MAVQTGGRIQMKLGRSVSFALAALLGLAVLANAPAALAKQAHHDGKALMKDKSDGHHDIDHHGKHTVSVEMRHGKIHEFHVKHSEKGEIAVKKYKTHKKMALNAPNAHVVYASYDSAAMQEDLGSTWVGYSYIDDNGDEQIYWYPAEMIEDPYTGAIDYVPLDQ
jgi:hypothetical protein